MTRRWMWIGAVAALIVLAGGGYYYCTRGVPAAQPQRPRDPGFVLLLSIRTVESKPETRLTKEQITKVLPFIKALKDVPTSDAEAAAVIARAVRETLTPAQQAALEEARRRFVERQRTQGVPGATGPGGSAALGPGGPGALGLGAPGGQGASGFTDEQRAQMRTRTFERMIRYLEQRMR